MVRPFASREGKSQNELVWFVVMRVVRSDVCVMCLLLVAGEPITM
jgi:hypothetical protein